MSVFAFGSDFTIGLEEEILLVDESTLQLAPVASDVLGFAAQQSVGRGFRRRRFGRRRREVDDGGSDLGHDDARQAHERSLDSKEFLMSCHPWAAMRRRDSPFVFNLA